MKKFAMFQSGKETPEIIEGVSAVVVRSNGFLTVTINHGERKKTTFKNVIIFTEVSEKIKVMWETVAEIY